MVLRHLSVSILTATLLTICGTALAASGSFDFSTDPSGDWVTYEQVYDSGYADGSWSVYDSSNKYLELVQDGTGNAMGHAWLNQKLPSASFDFSYRWQPTQAGTGLDGFTFGWVEDIDPGLGNAGGCMGAFRGEGKPQPGYSGYFVEVDFHDNSECDPGAYHYGLMKSGPLGDTAPEGQEDTGPIGTTPTFASGTFSTDEWYRMRIVGEWNGNDRVVNMWVDEPDPGNGWAYTVDDASPRATWTIPDYEMPSSVYYGFSSGTGGKDGSFRIDDVQYTATPAPAAVVLFPIALGAVALVRRRRHEA